MSNQQNYLLFLSVSMLILCPVLCYSQTESSTNGIRVDSLSLYDTDSVFDSIINEHILKDTSRYQATTKRGELPKFIKTELKNSKYEIKLAKKGHRFNGGCRRSILLRNYRLNGYFTYQRCHIVVFERGGRARSHRAAVFITNEKDEIIYGKYIVLLGFNNRCDIRVVLEVLCKRAYLNLW